MVNLSESLISEQARSRAQAVDGLDHAKPPFSRSLSRYLIEMLRNFMTRQLFHLHVNTN